MGLGRGDPSGMIDYEYDLECPVCDVGLSVTVENTEEKPAYCPMCGTQVEWEEVE